MHVLRVWRTRAAGLAAAVEKRKFTVQILDDIPTILTKRLRLRGHRTTDLPQCLALWSDERVTRFITGRASTEQQTWARLLSYVGHWTLLGFGYWVIEHSETNDFVGEIGLADFRRDVTAWPAGTPELGFALAPRFHGQGYASECVAAVLSWADVNLDAGRTACLINPNNIASIRIAHKAAYKELEAGRFNDQPVVFFVREREVQP